MIVIYDSENYFPATQLSPLGFVVSTEICGNYKNNLIPLSELEPPGFLKNILAQNRNNVTYLAEIFAKSYEEFLLHNTAAFLILGEFSRHFEVINLVCENKFPEFNFCQFLYSILSTRFEVQTAGER